MPTARKHIIKLARRLFARVTTIWGCLVVTAAVGVRAGADSNSRNQDKDVATMTAGRTLEPGYFLLSPTQGRNGRREDSKTSAPKPELVYLEILSRGSAFFVDGKRHSGMLNEEEFARRATFLTPAFSDSWGAEYALIILEDGTKHSPNRTLSLHLLRARLVDESSGKTAGYLIDANEMRQIPPPGSRAEIKVVRADRTMKAVNRAMEAARTASVTMSFDAASALLTMSPTSLRLLDDLILPMGDPGYREVHRAIFNQGGYEDMGPAVHEETWPRRRDSRIAGAKAMTCEGHLGFSRWGGRFDDED